CPDKLPLGGGDQRIEASDVRVGFRLRPRPRSERIACRLVRRELQRQLTDDRVGGKVGSQQQTLELIAPAPAGRTQSAEQAAVNLRLCLELGAPELERREVRLPA